MAWDHEQKSVLERLARSGVCDARRKAAWAALEEIERLTAAIRKHRDQRGDDRCWLDDEELYRVLGEPNTARTVLPKECEFLESCRRFWKQRQHPVDVKHSKPNDMTMRQLEDEIERLLKEQPLTLGRAT